MAWTERKLLDIVAISERYSHVRGAGSAGLWRLVNRLARELLRANRGDPLKKDANVEPATATSAKSPRVVLVAGAGWVDVYTTAGVRVKTLKLRAWEEQELLEGNARQETRIERATRGLGKRCLVLAAKLNDEQVRRQILFEALERIEKL